MQARRNRGGRRRWSPLRGVERLEPRCLLVSYITLSPPGPITQILLGDDGSFQIQRAGDFHGSVFPGEQTPGDAGFFARPRGAFGPGPVVGLDIGGRRAQGWRTTASFTNSTAWYPLLQKIDDDGLGALLIADNRLDGNTQGFAYQMVQHVRYEPGLNAFRVDVALVNLGTAPLVLDAFTAADLMVDDGNPRNDNAFADDDFGFGWYDTTTGGVGGVDFAGNNRFFVVSNPDVLAQPTGFQSGQFNAIWQTIGNGGHLDNTVRTRTIDPPTQNDLSFQNNGTGLEWQGLTIAPGGAQRLSYTWSFDGWAGRSTAVAPTLAAAPVQARAGESFQGSVASFGGTIMTSMAGDYLATVHWGDGSATERANVVANPNGTGYLVATSHTFANAGQYPVTVTVIGPSGETGTVQTTAEISNPGGGGGTPGGQVQVSAILDPGSDLGASNQDGITSQNRPLIWGYATVGSNVTVSLTNRDTGAATSYSATAASDGGWYGWPASPLADGSYRVTVEARLPSGVGGVGQATVFSDTAPMVIDTVAPRLTTLEVTPQIGRLIIGFADERSSIDHTTTGDARNYLLAQRVAGGTRPRSLTATHAPGGRIVLMTRRLRSGAYNFTVLAGVRDVAGNTFQGQFSGPLPSGDGRPGMPFLAILRMNNVRLLGIDPVLGVQRVRGRRG